ncbi:hypothetical protein TNCV_2316701 [Trichonephila clavipes]|nr:hypothetical protein TNCV_2316701 [Trichonephila clavipes]
MATKLTGPQGISHIRQREKLLGMVLICKMKPVPRLFEQPSVRERILKFYVGGTLSPPYRGLGGPGEQATQTDPTLSNIICPPLQCITPISSKKSITWYLVFSFYLLHVIFIYSRQSTSFSSGILPTTIQSESLLQIPIPTTTTTTSPGNNLNNLVSPLETESHSHTTPATLNSISTENFPESTSLMNPIVNILQQLKPTNCKRKSRNRRKRPKNTETRYRNKKKKRFHIDLEMQHLQK